MYIYIYVYNVRPPYQTHFLHLPGRLFGGGGGLHRAAPPQADPSCHGVNLPNSPKPTLKVQEVGQIWLSTIPKVGRVVNLVVVTVTLVVVT